MMLTEKEARTKWCPFIHTRITVVLPAGDRHSEERAEHLGRDDRCIASRCMAWRGDIVRTGAIVERVPVLPNSRLPEGFSGSMETPTGRDWVRQEMREVGYCGLAGSLEAVS